MSPARAPRRRVLAAVAVLALGACSGGPRLGAREFRVRADAECAKLLAASEELGLAQSEGASGEEVRGYVRAAADGLRDLTTGLSDLRPPDSLQSGTDDLVVALDEYADGLDEVASRVEDGQGLTEALNAAPKLVARLNRIADRATGLVVALGLEGCRLGP